MNPETIFPILKTMESCEIFIERAWIVRGKEILKLKPLKMIKKADRETYARQLRDMFNGEEINLSYYSK
jgi:hypothetical protein